jgi:glutathione S-transferase
MSEVLLHTNVFSPYGWTARMVAAEKGVPHRIVAVDTSSPAHRRLHPFGKMPVLEHGRMIVYETLAIAHYLDRAFDGPPLQPDDVVGQTDVLRWISVVNGYCFAVMNGLVKERTAGSWRAEPTNEATIESLRGPLAMQLSLIGEAVADRPYLTGEAFTLADAFLFPQLHFAAFTPEGSEALAAAPAVEAWLQRVRARPSFAATNPFVGG